MPRRRSAFFDQYEKWCDVHPRLAARTYAQAVAELREMEAGLIEPRHDGDTVEHRLVKARRWRDAMRAVGICKKCGERLDGASDAAALARARGIGATCWERLTPEERDAITAWIDRTRDSEMEEPT